MICGFKNLANHIHNTSLMKGSSRTEMSEAEPVLSPHIDNDIRTFLRTHPFVQYSIYTIIRSGEWKQ